MARLGRHARWREVGAKMVKTDDLSVRNATAATEWGSDAMAEVLCDLGIHYLSLVPGASYRGIHDSVVNVLENRQPQILLCLHEEHAVAIAHGYAKVTGEPMAVALHSNVGLMHAMMAMFNAYCARVPMLVLGATGPLDAMQRRPWIDWIHTVADQGALIRNFSKWDDQPGSVGAALESLVRAHSITCTYPSAPTYVCIDSALQEGRLDVAPSPPDLERHRAVPAPGPTDETVEEIVALATRARRPLFLIGRVGRTTESWNERVRLVEALGAYVLTDFHNAAAFPTTHRAHPIPPMRTISNEGARLVRDADLIVALDWVDLASTLRASYGGQRVEASVISCTMDHVLHNGWSKDHFGLAPIDLAVSAHPDALVRGLCQRLGAGAQLRRWEGYHLDPAPVPADVDSDEISVAELARAMNRCTEGRAVTFSTVSLGWPSDALRLEGPLDYLGGDGGGGVGYGPGGTIGAALALAGSGRIVIGVIGDGDFLMSSSALWTAAHYEIPALFVIVNNRSFFNDEVHQHRMAVTRGRPVENRWIGQHIREPEPDLAQIARSYGLVGYGPIRVSGELSRVLPAALAEVEAGTTVVVDVHVGPTGYPAGDAVTDRRRT